VHPYSFASLLIPLQTLLWDFNMLPRDYYQGESSLALPSLNLQFLTFPDYLLRNFTLFRLETTSAPLDVARVMLNACRKGEKA